MKHVNIQRSLWGRVCVYWVMTHRVNMLPVLAAPRAPSLQSLRLGEAGGTWRAVGSCTLGPGALPARLVP